MSPTTCNPDAETPANIDLERELEELAAEYAPRNARERSLVATILLAERELRKLDRISRLSAAPCDSPAFTRSFNAARNGKHQANRDFDRLRAAAELPQSAGPRGKAKAKAEPAPAAATDVTPFPDEPWIRDTRYQVGDITCLFEDGWSDAEILADRKELIAEDLQFSRDWLAAQPPPEPEPSYRLDLPKAATTLALLIGIVLLWLLGAGASFPEGRSRPLPAMAAVGHAAHSLEDVGGGLHSGVDSPILSQLIGEENSETLQQQGRGRGARKSDGDHQREEVGDHHLVRPGYPRHGLAGGADRPPDGPDQGSGRSLQDA